MASDDGVIKTIARVLVGVATAPFWLAAGALLLLFMALFMAPLFMGAAIVWAFTGKWSEPPEYSHMLPEAPPPTTPPPEQT